MLRRVRDACRSARRQRPSGDGTERGDQAWIDVERLDPVERQTALFGLLAGADVDVVEDLEVVGQELNRDDEDGSPSGGRYLRHEVGEIRRHPLSGLVTGALPAEGPVPIRQTGAFGHRPRGRPKLGEVVRLAFRHEPRQAVGRHEDAHRLSLIWRKSVERVGDSTAALRASHIFTDRYLGSLVGDGDRIFVTNSFAYRYGWGAPVNTASTPGAVFARATSMLRTRACA